jgi:hypothetical protein
MVGCTPSVSDIPISIYIPSFKENYPMLLDEAKKWESDAYLSDAVVNFHTDMRYAVSASFYSPSQDFESITIHLMWDGTKTSEVFSYEHPINHHKPITLNDWSIDSQEILEYIPNSDIRHKINSNNDICSFLKLERFLPQAKQPVVWMLKLWNCSSPSQTMYLDANTGYILDLTRIIPPTRFPTKTPHE